MITTMLRRRMKYMIPIMILTPNFTPHNIVFQDPDSLNITDDNSFMENDSAAFWKVGQSEALYE